MSISIKIDHVAMMVSDLERSLKFFRDLLGLEVVSPEEHNDGPISEMTAMPKVHMREYRLRALGTWLRAYAPRGARLHAGPDRLAEPAQPAAALSPQPCAQRPHLFRGGGRPGHLPPAGGRRR